MSPTPPQTLTFDFHPQAQTVISPYQSPLLSWSGGLFLIVTLVVAAMAIRSLYKSTGSFSLSGLDYGPILLGLLAEYGFLFAVQILFFVLILRIELVGHPGFAELVQCVSMVGRVLAFGCGGAVVWKGAQRSRLGHVLVAAIVALGVDAVLMFAFTPLRLMPVFVRLFVVKELLIPAMFIGAWLAQRRIGAKEQAA